MPGARCEIRRRLSCSADTRYSYAAGSSRSERSRMARYASQFEVSARLIMKAIAPYSVLWPGLDAAESRASFDGGGVPAGTSPPFGFAFWF